MFERGLPQSMRFVTPAQKQSRAKHQERPSTNQAPYLNDEIEALQREINRKNTQDTDTSHLVRA